LADSAKLSDLQGGKPMSKYASLFSGNLQLLLVLLLFSSGCTGQQQNIAGQRQARSTGANVHETGFAIVAPLPEIPTLEDYLARAALMNPGLKAAWHNWQAGLHRSTQKRYLPDPQFTYGYFIREVETRVGPQRHKISLGQKFPWPSKLILAAQAADAQARASGQRYQKAKLALFHKVKDAYYQYYFLSQSIEITTANLQLLQQLEAVARARYRSSSGKHPDVIRAQLELSSLEDRLASLKAMRKPLVSQLLYLTADSSRQQLPWPGKVPADVQLAMGGREIVAQMKRSNPDLAAMAEDILAAEKAVSLARRSVLPDVTLGVTWIPTDEPDGPMPDEDRGKDPLAFTVGFSLPLWYGRHRAARKAAQSKLHAVRLFREETSNMLIARIEKIIFEIQDAQRKRQLYRGKLLPKAKEALQSVQASYRGGKASFLSLVEAQRIRLQFQLELVRSITTHHRKLAVLEMLVGHHVDLTFAGAKPKVNGKRPKEEH
jgi:outer membrane protein, heavy metal efflux system